MRGLIGDFREAAGYSFEPWKWLDNLLGWATVIYLAVMGGVSFLVGNYSPLGVTTHKTVTPEGVVLSEITLEPPSWLIGIAVFFFLAFATFAVALVRRVRADRLATTTEKVDTTAILAVASDFVQHGQDRIDERVARRDRRATSLATIGLSKKIVVTKRRLLRESLIQGSQIRRVVQLFIDDCMEIYNRDDLSDQASAKQQLVDVFESLRGDLEADGDPRIRTLEDEVEALKAKVPPNAPLSGKPAIRKSGHAWVIEDDDGTVTTLT
ncbi:MAG: hypothetical protein HQ478_04405 [Chloroflexi bacterium]|nr:hypothetical protein [Chloroflexota bacterium]